MKEQVFIRDPGKLTYWTLRLVKRLLYGKAFTAVWNAIGKINMPDMIFSALQTNSKGV